MAARFYKPLLLKICLLDLILYLLLVLPSGWLFLGPMDYWGRRLCGILRETLTCRCGGWTGTS